MPSYYKNKSGDIRDNKKNLGFMYAYKYQFHWFKLLQKKAKIALIVGYESLYVYQFKLEFLMEFEHKGRIYFSMIILNLKDVFHK